MPEWGVKNLTPVLALFLATTFIGSATGATPVSEAPASRASTRKQKLWKVSLAILGAATVADVQSSMGRRELNPLLNSSSGRFTMQGVAIKSAIVGGAIGIQYLLLRRNPSPSAYTAAAVTNFGVAAVTGTFAARNHMVK